MNKYQSATIQAALLFASVGAFGLAVVVTIA